MQPVWGARAPASWSWASNLSLTVCAPPSRGVQRVAALTHVSALLPLLSVLTAWLVGSGPLLKGMVRIWAWDIRTIDVGSCSVYVCSGQEFWFPSCPWDLESRGKSKQGSSIEQSKRKPVLFARTSVLPVQMLSSPWATCFMSLNLGLLILLLPSSHTSGASLKSVWHAVAH